LPHNRIALYTVVAVLAVVVIAIVLANLSQVTTGVIVVASVTYFVANAMFWFALSADLRFSASAGRERKRPGG